MPNERDVSKTFSFSRDRDLVSLKAEELKRYMETKPLGMPGVRVMSVDLGVRYGAAISVFEVKPFAEVRKDKLHYPITGCEGFVAEHERSVILKLPGKASEQQGSRVRGNRRLLRYGPR
ncbi:hypothetical protein GCM10025857_12620 [Alicyclobacillus contaminans]|nr:hypothetical protein GCM10025857_12620 [Alicyclobacillus contaminans]